MVVLAGVAAVTLHRLSDPERLRRHAQEQAREAWARDLTIGDISLLWLPLPALSATDVTLGEAPGEKDPWKLHADRVLVGLQLLPLLIGKARPRNASLEGDVTHNERKLKVAVTLHDLSGFGAPNAASDGKLELDWGATRATVTGRIPLQRQLRGADFKAKLESSALNDLMGFFGLERPRKTAPAQAAFGLKASGDRLEVVGLDATLGKHRITGEARVATGGAKPVIDARVQSDRLDWPQILLESGDAPVPPLPADQVLYDRPIAWPLLVALDGHEGKVAAHFGSLRLRNGIELKQVKADMAFDGPAVDVKGFTANLLGGTGKGTMHLEGRRKELRVDLHGDHLLLERWFKERGSDVEFTGGPMTVTAKLAGTGDSLRDLSKAMNGRVTIRMGPGVYRSEKAGEAEARMASFSKKGAKGGIDFECASASLPFAQGRAAGEAIVGARSDLTRLLTSGYISMREVAVDLRGRLRPKPGTGAGFADIAKDIRISGNIRDMKVRLDPADAGRTALRAGAAVATLGLSVAGSAAANTARGEIDPCAMVFEGAPR